MNIRNAIIVLVIIALAAGIGVYLGSGSEDNTKLVPAWQLTKEHAYNAMQMVDPVVSWSPDSRTLLFSEMSMKSHRCMIYKWNVGERKLQLVVKDAVSPNYVQSGKSFVYLKLSPRGVYQHSAHTTKEIEVLSGIKASEFWGETTAVLLNQTSKTITLRMTSFTRYYMPGTEVRDWSGKLIGDDNRSMCEGVLDYSDSPDGSKCALLVDGPKGEQTLQIADKGKNKGKMIATGSMGSVAWSPNGKMIAYGDGCNLSVISPNGKEKAIVGKFGVTENNPDSRYVCRLNWSPNSDFLAALVYVPDESGNYPLLYVLDMSKFQLNNK